MNKIKIAETISTITNPPIITIPLFLIICIVLSYENGVFSLNKFIVLELISLVFASILPMAIILYWAKKLNTDKDISNRQDRFTPLIVGVVSYLIGFFISLLLNVDHFLTLLLLCYAVNTFIVMLITLKWKISVHTTGMSGPVGALILLLGPFGALFAILYPIMIWSRVLLEKHTLAQAICGAVQGFFLTVLEMYLYMFLFNMPIDGLVSLEMSILYILAIIVTPVLLGLLSYSHVAEKKIVFYLMELVFLWMFLINTPLSVTAIYVVISITSILVSYFAGEDFVWFRILNSS
ncbi:hypothetical protein [Methanobrevibacter sp.]|uniref:hypothetical protein n=1 Tax=Methanobrevibacter sp. TaxID=66852 RepID=UPI0025FDEC42|nr:hypothetical protein [Methanobrevibacter sp.]MBQ6512565.1 hypothetical protein [Methanobrevibacter sp.]